MMKRTIILLVALIMVLTLVGCGKAIDKKDENVMKTAGFKQIENEETLFYSEETKVVYYIFSMSGQSGYAGFGYGYMAPYISENGKFCRYINDEIVEITGENTDN